VKWTKGTPAIKGKRGGCDVVCVDQKNLVESWEKRERRAKESEREVEVEMNEAFHRASRKSGKNRLEAFSCKKKRVEEDLKRKEKKGQRNQ
jgi:hypothetical protein